MSYSTINTSRSALSLVLNNIEGYTVGEHPLVIRFLKAVGRQRPPKPRYDSIWDAELVIDLFKRWPCNENLSLRSLTLKLVGMISLLSAQRVQTLAAIDIVNIHFNTTGVEICIPMILKTSKPGKLQPSIVLQSYEMNVNICPVNVIKRYLEVTKDFRKSNNLFLSLESPHNAVTSQTISRWLKLLLSEAGIDTSIFKAHSYRHSSTTKAAEMGVSIDVIFSRAGWTRSSSMFARYYKKQIDNRYSFANAILST